MSNFASSTLDNNGGRFTITIKPCNVSRPMGRCILDKGHRGPHRAEQGAEWPYCETYEGLKRRIAELETDLQETKDELEWTAHYED